MTGLNVRIGADATQYNQTMAAVPQTAAQAMGQTEQAVVSGGRRINAAITTTANNVRQGSDRAGFALTNLSRVASDAPFGFIAIQNNISPLIDSFGLLVRETGSVGGAFRSMLSSLTGPAGLGIAVAVITAGITVYTQYQQKAKHATDESKGSIDGYTKSIQEGINSGAKELANLSSLYDATQNHNLSLNERKKAVDALQDQYPDYFKNIKDEAILAGQAAGAYDRLSNSIINSALVKAGQDQLAEQLKPLLQLTTTLAQEQAKIDEANKKAQANNPAKITRFDMSDGDGNIEKGFRAVVPSGTTNRTMSTNNSFVQDENGDLQNVADYQKQITDRIKQAQAAIQSLIEKFGINTILPKSFKQDEPKKVKEGFAALEEEIKKNDTQIENAVIDGNTSLSESLQERGRILETRLKELKAQYDLMAMIAGRKPIENPPSAGVQRDITSGVVDDPLANIDVDKLKEWSDEQIRAKKVTGDYSAELAKQQAWFKTIEDTIGNGLMGAFQSALSGTQSFLSSFGSFLEQLIIKIAAAAAAAFALSAVLALVTGGSSLLAGAGASTGFSTLFSGFSGLPKFAEGAIVNKPTVGLFGEAGPEAIMPLDKLDNFVSSNQSGGEWAPRTQLIKGDMLITWTKQANESYSRRT